MVILQLAKWPWVGLPAEVFAIITLILFSLFTATPAVYGSSRARVESEMQLLAYTTATAMLDLLHILDLRHSLRQRWILNPLSEARDRTLILLDTMLGS